MTQATKFPLWAPELLCENLQEGAYDYNFDFVELVTRLITYPEMETVWQQWREWDNIEFDFSEEFDGEDILYYGETSWYAHLLEIAFNAVSDTSKTEVTPREKRNETLGRVAKHAKQLNQSLDSLGMRDNILWYFTWTSVEEVFRTAALEMYKAATGEQSFAGLEDMNSDIEVCEEWRRLGIHQPTLESILNFFVDSAIRESALSSENKKSFSIRELLNILADEEEMNRRLPHTLVQRAKTENKGRHYLIRKLAAEIKSIYNRDPLKEREFISNFARTVLDAPEINEDIVKDSLRGFKLPTYYDSRNKAKK